MMDARSGDTRRPQFTPRDQDTQTTRVPHDQTTPAQKRSARR